MRRKITVVGAGNVGATTAQRLAERDYADIVLVDIVEGMPQGKALDLNQSGPVVGYEPNSSARTHTRRLPARDIVVITSGLPRKPGMSRDDLLAANREIVGGCHEERSRSARPTRSSSASRTRSTRCATWRSRRRASRVSAWSDGGHPRLGALPHLPRVGARRVGARRDRLRARRPRRHDGPDHQLHERRRSPGDPEDRRRPPGGDRAAHARRRRRGGEAAEDGLRVLRAVRRGGRDGGLDRVRPEARAAMRRLLRRRVRHRRPVRRRAGEARQGGRRGDHRDRAVRAGEGGAAQVGRRRAGARGRDGRHGR